MATIAGAFIYALICGSAFFWKTAALATVAGNFPAVIQSWLPPFAERPALYDNQVCALAPLSVFAAAGTGAFAGRHVVKNAEIRISPKGED